MKNLKTSYLILFVALIIFIAPWIFTFPFFWDRFNYSITGQIGDTIGGITAPFINGLAAILVFITFREQVRANKLLEDQSKSLQNQEQSKNIMDQINSIADNKIKVEDEASKIINMIDHIRDEDYKPRILVSLNQVLYFLSEFDLAIDVIEKYEGKKNFLYRKLNYLYQIRFAVHLDLLHKKLSPVHNNEGNLHTEAMAEILFAKQKLDEYFNDLTRFENQ